MVLDLQKRYHSEDNWERWKTGRDKPATFHRYNIFLYTATVLVFATTPRSKHHQVPQRQFPQCCAKQLTPLANAARNSRPLSN